MDLKKEFKMLGEIIDDQRVLANKLKKVKAFIFDWDGVFHNGYKKNDGVSYFSEADSMGVNMMRFSYFLINRKIPYTAIISGENNKTASYLAKREHFDHIFLEIKNKIEILNWLTLNHGFRQEEVLFIFDDIIDLSFAKHCGIRFMVKRDASFMFTSYCKKNMLYDYLSFNNGGNHALREISEFVLALTTNYDKLIEKRINYDSDYTNYLEQRNSIITQTSIKKISAT